LSQFNYIAVVGDEELESETLDIRARDGQRLGKMTVEQFEMNMINEYPECVREIQK
jgi:threonyl-tRNA synthetase